MKKTLALLLALTMLLICTGCGKHQSDQDESQNPDALITTVPEEKIVPNPLTGEPLSNPDSVNNRPVAVMLNNIHYAMPQHGVSDADIIFEYNVEGGITRMMGLFQEIDTKDTIGSVRSARPCFLETAMGMDAIYVHAGGSDEAMNMIYRYDVDDIDEGAFGCFWRDEKRAEIMDYEHTLMTKGSLIHDYITSSGWRLQHEADYRYPVTFVDDGTPHSGTDATDISVKFSNYKTGTFTYDPATKLYMIGQYDDAYIDGNTGNQVGVTNLLILRTSVYNSGDSSGHMVIDVCGSDEGVYICGGKAMDIQWHKEDIYDPFTYTTTDGTPLSLGIGKTYVCVVDYDAYVSIT